MGLIERLLALVLGGGFRDTVELFRENAESGAARDAARSDAALRQFAAEFGAARPGLFDRVMDGLNRLPRPALALGTLGLFVSAMVDPVWFASRMQGIALVPEPLWWLMGAIVSFYFGARYQAKGQEFRRSIAATLAGAPEVARNLRVLRALDMGAGAADPGTDADAALAASAPGANPALEDWRRANGQ